MGHPIFDANVESLAGVRQDLSAYRGQVLLLVNTASECGFTPQYKGLQELHERYAEAGLAVLGFPCNQFGHQEPGTADEIQDFCQTKFGVSFPMYAKIEVNGANTHPLYRHLKEAAPGLLGSGAIKWNFTKFLVNRRGEIAERFAPQTPPAQIATRIEELLAEEA